MHYARTREKDVFPVDRINEILCLRQRADEKAIKNNK